MGTYYIPRNVKGETRILTIFTIKALITTLIGGLIGLIPYGIFSMVGAKKIGVAFLIVLSVIGYGIGMIKIPTLPGIKITKKIGGEPLSEIMLRYIKFLKNRKVYLYFSTKEKGGRK